MFICTTITFPISLKYTHSTSIPIHTMYVHSHIFPNTPYDANKGHTLATHGYSQNSYDDLTYSLHLPRLGRVFPKLPPTLVAPGISQNTWDYFAPRSIPTRGNRGEGCLAWRKSISTRALLCLTGICSNSIFCTFYTQSCIHMYSRGVS